MEHLSKRASDGNISTGKLAVCHSKSSGYAVSQQVPPSQMWKDMTRFLPRSCEGWAPHCRGQTILEGVQNPSARCSHFAIHFTVTCYPYKEVHVTAKMWWQNSNNLPSILHPQQNSPATVVPAKSDTSCPFLLLRIFPLLLNKETRHLPNSDRRLFIDVYGKSTVLSIQPGVMPPVVAFAVGEC